jgi:hypothetical protein
VVSLPVTYQILTRIGRSGVYFHVVMVLPSGKVLEFVSTELSQVFRNIDHVIQSQSNP